jgi:23S rRNA pseudouridine1911/1915/1917 synthase
MGESLRLAVGAEHDGERLDKTLADMLDISRSVARSLVDEGVLVDGAPGKPNTRLSSGSTLETPPPPQPEELQPEPMDLALLHEDEAVVVVDKPPGLVVHPGAGNPAGTLAAGLLHRFPEIAGVGSPGRWGLIHRLDKFTSGALLVARTQGSYDFLVSELRARRIEREYMALVEGTMRPPTGTIDAPIGRDPDSPLRRALVRDGKAARTHYRVLENLETADAALVAIRLETGRTHQIRVHLSAIGHPVVGDRAYGAGPALSAPRTFLHAARLAFQHPVTNDRVEVESPLPEDLAQVLEDLARRSS